MILAAGALAWSAGRATAAAQPILIVVPNQFTNKQAEGALCGPFWSTHPNRSQQFYGASQFGAISQSGGWITGIGFRTGAHAGEWFSANMPSLQVNLSTTTKALNQLSSLFAENIGADETIVFGPAPRDMEYSSWGTYWPENLAVGFTRPFFYDPRRGNLLMDVFNWYGSVQPTGALEAAGYLGCPVWFLQGTMGVAAAYSSSQDGMVTRFEVLPAPPSPTLGMTRAGPAAILRWPTDAADFVLEATSALVASNQWAAVTNVPVVSGTNNTVTNSLLGGNQFYRLRYVLAL